MNNNNNNNNKSRFEICGIQNVILVLPLHRYMLLSTVYSVPFRVLSRKKNQFTLVGVEPVTFAILEQCLRLRESTANTVLAIHTTVSGKNQLDKFVNAPKLLLCHLALLYKCA